MTRHLSLSLATVLVLGCGGSLPDARQAAVHVEVSYDFKAGCIAVLAQDKAAPDKQDKEQKPVLDREPVEAGTRNREADFAVFRRDDWGRTLVITVTAHEQTCEGPEVARKVEEVTLDKAGTQTVPVSLSAADVDEDGYVASAGGGTDCNDANVTIRPGQTESCDGVDNNCTGGVDDGLTLTDFFADGDGDGAGAGAAVKACSAPANHVASSNDCDDTTNTRTPGKAEVCDGVDNNCIGGTDEGLPVTNYFQDLDGDGAGGGAPVSACAQPANHVTIGNDCDDNNSARTPGKTEVCDELDNNCNATVDEGLSTSTFHRDADGDGIGVAGTTQVKCRATTGYVAPTPTFDCDDTTPEVKPGATEVCNNIDDNCANGTDEGFDKTWHRDVDNDGYGLQNTTQTNCTQPSGFVRATPGFDCDDTLSTVNPGATEVCNNRDDNCATGTDENFPTKGDPCMNDVCTGQLVCKADTTGVECSAPAPVSYFPDADADGEGQTGSTVQKVCNGSTPAGKVQNSTDCDDQDPHNKSTGTEVCDDRDNNCANGKTDETTICGGKGWKLLTEPVVTSRNWNTVAVGDGGEPVWLAGEAGALAFRGVGTTTFTDRNQICGTNRWNAAWVQPGTGTVFLAGDGGTFAAYNGVTACVMANTGSATGSSSGRPLVGIVGFGASNTVYALNDEGAVYSWTPGVVPAFKAQRNPQDPVTDLHGSSASGLLLVGASSSNSRPTASGYDAVAAGATVVNHSVPTENNKNLTGVWAWDSTHAYAVGRGGNVLKWNGTTGWSAASPDVAVTTQFNSVVAFDDSSVYIATSDGKIRRPKGTTWEVHYTGAVELEDIAASSRQNIWAVGNGVVVHFPE